MIISRAELESFRGRTVPEVLGPQVRLLLVGINPGLRSAALGAPFEGGSNRFYPALYRAGITRRQINASNGLAPDDLAELHARHRHHQHGSRSIHSNERKRR